MTVPQWVLLAFAMWTLLVLWGTVGVHRWSHILTGRARVSEWPSDRPHGAPWYQRGTRAHMNCIENLPVYGAIIVCATVVGVKGPLMDELALAIIASRIAQTSIHIAFVQTDVVVSIRFSLYMVQGIAMAVMLVLVAIAAGA